MSDTGNVSPEQAVNHLILGGWIPVRGGGARHPVSLHVVDIGDDRLWRGAEGGGFASGDCDQPEWNLDTVVSLYETMRKLGL